MSIFFNAITVFLESCLHLIETTNGKYQMKKNYKNQF